MTGFRLDRGGHIDRAAPLAFTFDGRAYRGYQGDTLASALIANGVRIVGRSFKSHRPRGIIAAGPEEAGAILRLGRGGDVEPHARATMTPLYDGLTARSLNCWPSAAFDVFAVLRPLHRFFSAGFYYKTFLWPSWQVYAPWIRRLAGLGHLPDRPDPDEYEPCNAHCDLLIVGGGPAGLMAALTAARSGARIILADENLEFGGALRWEREPLEGRSARQWTAAALAQLRTFDHVTLLPRTTVFGYYDHNMLAMCERVSPLPPANAGRAPVRERLWHVRARQVILATGAIERPLVFANNDRPGVMLASAVRHYLNLYAAAPGKRLVVFTNNDSAYRTALDAHAAGLDVAAIVDARPQPRGACVEQVRARGLTVLTGHAITQALGARGVKAVSVTSLAQKRPARRFECDVVACSGGWSPNVHLFSQSGGRLRYDEALACFRPHLSVQKERSAGAANGAFDLGACFEEGRRAALASLEDLGLEADPPDIPLTEQRQTDRPLAFWQVPAHCGPVKDAPRYVDLMHDVTATDVRVAVQENFRAVEHFKRYTTTGMAPDQGKTSTVTALALLAEESGRTLGEIGTTKFRPPYTPVTLGALAGRRRGAFLSPRPRLRLHDLHLRLGAVMEDYGGWLRPAFYPQAQESEENAIAREARQVRTSVGLLDYSPLGKIEVRGRDAAAFLHHIYANDVKKLKPGRCRYGLMLTEHGALLDDGIIARLGPDHFHLTTTSGNARRVADWLEEWRQCEWPHWDVAVIPVSSGWGTVMVTGPRARDLVSRLALDVNLAPEALPHMSVRLTSLKGVPVRLMRVSFTGELGFEISVPAGYTPALWHLLHEAGRDLGVIPFGVEALMVLRTEKGFIHVGVDTDSATLPDDLGLSGLYRAKAEDFIGKRSLRRPEALRSGREQLVGLKATGTAALPVGGLVVPDRRRTRPVLPEGRVTSSVFSPTLNMPVALGLLKSGRQRLGETVVIYHQGSYWQAEVTRPCAYDPEGVKSHA